MSSYPHREVTQDEQIRNQSLLISSLFGERDLLAHQNASLKYRLEIRDRQRLAAFIGGVLAAGVGLGALYLLASYDLAQIADRALRAVGL